MRNEIITREKIKDECTTKLIAFMGKIMEKFMGQDE